MHTHEYIYIENLCPHIHKFLENGAQGSYYLPADLKYLANSSCSHVEKHLPTNILSTDKPRLWNYSVTAQPTSITQKNPYQGNKFCKFPELRGVWKRWCNSAEAGHLKHFCKDVNGFKIPFFTAFSLFSSGELLPGVYRNLKQGYWPLCFFSCSRFLPMDRTAACEQSTRL